MFQPEDEKELAEKFSDKHRKTILKPQKKGKNQELYLITNFLHSFVLLIKILSISATYSSNPCIFFTFILKGNSKESSLKGTTSFNINKKTRT